MSVEFNPYNFIPRRFDHSIIFGVFAHVRFGSRSFVREVLTTLRSRETSQMPREMRHALHLFCWT